MRRASSSSSSSGGGSGVSHTASSPASPASSSNSGSPTDHPFDPCLTTGGAVTASSSPALVINNNKHQSERVREVVEQGSSAVQLKADTEAVNVGSLVSPVSVQPTTVAGEVQPILQAAAVISSSSAEAHPFDPCLMTGGADTASSSPALVNNNNKHQSERAREAVEQGLAAAQTGAKPAAASEATAPFAALVAGASRGSSSLEASPFDIVSPFKKLSLGAAKGRGATSDRRKKAGNS